ncbi:MAG: hypothetical protein HYR91_14490 [Flavobacteriia bacterium]|nr:hypothetical protein [Flavobacteriia bacterium]
MRLLLLTFMLFFVSISYGQKKYGISFTSADFKLIKKNPSLVFKDSIEAKTYLQNFQKLAIKEGYLTASVDSILYLPNQMQISFHIGPQFKDAFLHLNSSEILFFRKYMRINEKLLSGLKFSPSEISRLLFMMQQTLQNNGFPFSKVYLDSIQMNAQNDLEANIKIEKNEFYNWRKIHVKGDSAISKVALMNIIRIKEGDKFSQEDLGLISKRIKQVSYLKEIKQYEILFTKEGAELFIYVKSVKLSSINGAVGLQPNSQTNKVNLTGDLALKLQNILKKGELIEFNWKSIQIQTQSMKAHVNYPFIFQSPFGIDALFHLYKRDSTYIETKANIGIQYFLRGGNYLKIFYQNDASTTLSGAANNPQFSNLNSVQTNSYGLSILKRQVDYIPNPRKGLVLNAEFSVGNRKSKSKLDSTILRVNTFRTEINFELYFPLYKRHVLKIANQTATYFAPEIFQNEVYRFGGLNNQRGMNEEELFATTKSTLCLEYRYLLDQNSRLFAYFDQSWYENNASKYYNDKPFGFGFGFSFGTNVGIFSISYAQGKQFNNPILIKNGKVHFGYVAYF